MLFVIIVKIVLYGWQSESAGVCLSKEAHAFVQVFAFFAEVKVEAVAHGHFVLSAFQSDAFGVGVVGVADVYAVEGASHESAHAVARTVVDAAVESLFVALVEQSGGDVSAQFGAVVA